jgi:hypothetical protein
MRMAFAALKQYRAHFEDIRFFFANFAFLSFGAKT